MTGDRGAVDVSVIIVNYNGSRWLEGCLRAAASQQGVTTEIILVDNASNDGSVDFVRRVFPEVRVLEMPRNLGFAEGNNAGAREARGRFLAFLNNDTSADPGWLRALLRTIDGSPDVGLVTSRIVYMHDPMILDSAGDGLTRAGGAFKRHHGRRVEEALETRDVFGACGAACLLRRDTFEAVGGFDGDFFMVYEDVDLSYRVQLRGERCVYVSDAVVAHAGSASLGRVSEKSVFLGQRNLEWMYFKNTPWPLLLASLPAHVVYDLAAFVYLAAHGFAKPFVAAKWSALRGAVQLWRKRRVVQAGRRTSLRRIWALMDGNWIGLKLREKRFDLKMAGPP